MQAQAKEEGYSRVLCTGFRIQRTTARQCENAYGFIDIPTLPIAAPYRVTKIAAGHDHILLIDGNSLRKS